VLITILAFLFVCGVLVLVHELGHHLMAKRLGVRVVTFSVGFGPRLLTIPYRGTDYCLSAIPLGGYVKMAGERPTDDHPAREDDFLAKTRWQRCQIFLAGPLMNVALAFFVSTGSLLYGVDVPSAQNAAPIIGAVADDSPAARAGIRRGDRILSVSGESVTTWTSLTGALATASGDVSLKVLRAGESITVNMRNVIAADAARGLRPDALPTTRFRAGPLDAVRLGAEAVVSSAGVILETIGNLLTGHGSPRDLTGPIGIAQVAGASARVSWMALFQLLALISLSVGIFNLMPIPLLDGGHIAMLAVEGVSGRDLDAGLRRSLLRAGVAVVLMLTIASVYNDLARIARFSSAPAQVETVNEK
jgi:regulator of sigma E protease